MTKFGRDPRRRDLLLLKMQELQDCDVKTEPGAINNSEHRQDHIRHATGRITWNTQPLILSDFKCGVMQCMSPFRDAHAEKYTYALIDDNKP